MTTQKDVFGFKYSNQSLVPKFTLIGYMLRNPTEVGERCLDLKTYAGPIERFHTGFRAHFVSKSFLLSLRIYEALRCSKMLLANQYLFLEIIS